MIIKSTDDRAHDLETLHNLLNHPSAPDETKKKIEKEIRFLSSGIKGEKEAAYEIDFDFGPSKNWAVIHDLRLEHAGRVAQIDHIIVNRLLEVWVCESKRFSQGIAVNDHGECSAFFEGKPYGVPSPFEQNRKHCVVLQSVLNDGVIELPKRLGFSIKPNIQSLVLVSKNARISRPKTRTEGIDEILKVDQVKTKIEKEADAGSLPLMLAKVVSQDTLESFAQSLAKLHVPAFFDWHGKFGLPKEVPVMASLNKLSVDEPSPKIAEETSQTKSKLACSSCETIVAYNVAKFCWFNKPRFGGKIYCYDCQKNVSSPQ